MNRLTASLLVLAGAASYGMLGPFVKMAYDAGFTPQDVTSSQFALALLILLLFAVFQWSGFQRIRWRDIRQLSVLGVLAAGTSVFYYMSLSYLPASMAIVFLFQFAWIVMLLDYLVTRRKPTVAKWVSVLFVVTGTVLAVNLFATDWSQISSLGLVLGFLSSITYSAFLYWNEKVTSEAPAIVNSLILTAASTILIFFVFPPTFAWNGSLTEGLWVWALIIGSLGQVIPPVLFNKAIPVVGGALAGILASIELPVAVVAASLLLGEAVTLNSWLGVAFILTGILIAEMRDPRQPLLQDHA
jgi:drug/metabolite transporter (DMT)-like permease